MHKSSLLFTKFYPVLPDTYWFLPLQIVFPMYGKCVNTRMLRGYPFAILMVLNQRFYNSPKDDLSQPKLRFFRSFPSSFTDPEWGSYNLCSSCSIVDFPQPDDPTKATHSPGFMWSDNPFRTCKCSEISIYYNDPSKIKSVFLYIRPNVTIETEN